MPNNNGQFIATIVEQSGSDSGKATLSNDAPTIIEKYKTPIVSGNDRMAVPGDNNEVEPEMSEFGNMENMPTLWLTDKQLPSANGLVVGDKVCFEIEAEVSNYSFNENSDGGMRKEFTFKLKKGYVKKEDPSAEVDNKY